MKTKNKVFVCLLLFSSIFGCKKQDLIKETSSQQNSVSEKTRYWLETQKGALSSPKFLLDGKVIDIPEKIDWGKSKYFPQSKINIIPVSIASIKSDLPAYKYLVTEMNDAGEVIKANYYAVINDRKMTAPIEDFSITPGLVNLQKIPGDFSGAIIKYDLSNNIIFTKHYEKGVLSNKTDKISMKKSKTIVPAQNYAPLPEGCSYVTIDWYWQVYENGVLVYEEYLYSSTIVVCEGGSGGGSGTPVPPTPLEICQIAVEHILDNTNSANYLMNSETVSQNPLQRTRNYTWKCVQGIGWYVVCHDRGVQKKLHLGDPWQWESLVNLSISKIGNTTSYGGTVTATKVSVEPTMGIYHCYMNSNIKITATSSYLGFTWTNEKEIISQFTYYIETTPDPGS